MGYPGLRYLPDLQEFRTEMQDFYHVVSAYEDHEHVYNQLRTRQAPSSSRGGIVASRVLQRLMDDRAKYGLQTQIIHLFRTYISGSHGPIACLDAPQGRQRFRLSGLQLPEVGLGRPAQGQDAQARGRDRPRNTS